MTEYESDLLALALGRVLLRYAEALDPKAVAETARSGAEKCLLDIQATLDRQDLTDFACIEEIAALLSQAGLGTVRHDFG